MLRYGFSEGGGGPVWAVYLARLYNLSPKRESGTFLQGVD